MIVAWVGSLWRVIAGRRICWGVRAAPNAWNNCLTGWVVVGELGWNGDWMGGGEYSAGGARI